MLTTQRTGLLLQHIDRRQVVDVLLRYVGGVRTLVGVARCVRSRARHPALAEVGQA